jgi:hypothetical protein
MSNYIRLVAVLLVIGAMIPIAASAREEVGATASSAPEGRRELTLQIDPNATDSNISSATATPFGYHLVWPVERSRTPGSLDKALLYLFLPATSAKPSDYTLIQQEAVDLGYHVIGLAYPNVDAVVGICNPTSTYSERQACYLNVRQQTVGGIPRDTTYTHVSDANTIYNRLTKLLVYMGENYPDEGWGGFLDETGSPKWSRIVVAGHSQGGGNAALIGKLNLVARVVMISSPPDGCFDHDGLPGSLPGCTDPNGTPLVGAQWTSPGGFGLPSLTPADRYYGLAHQSEFAITPMRANWGRLGLAALGPAVSPDPPNAPPYTCTHMLLTDLPAPGLPGIALSLQNHRLTARDDYTPKNPTTGLPILRDAWRYISAVSPGSLSGCNNGTLGY